MLERPLRTERAPPPPQPSLVEGEGVGPSSLANPLPPCGGGSGWGVSRAPCSLLIPEIRPPDRLVLADLGRGAGDDEAAGLDEIGVVGEVEGEVGVLLDEQ